MRQALAPGYAVEQEIAAGGMGVVYLAHDPRLDRPVAIKILRPGLASEVGAQRFLREARSLAKVAHPNVVQIHAADESRGIYYYVMEYLRGETLAQRLERGPLPPDAVAALGRAVLDGLAAVHAKQIVHRDIKPANVFLADRPVLIDFGIARAGDDSALTDGQVVGTRAYMPPEQREGGTTPASDLYAVAALLYEASTGRRWDATPAPEQANWSGVPRRLTRALTGGLAVDPAHRWPDATAFRHALRDPTSSGHRAVVGATVVAAGAAALLLWPAPHPPVPPTARADLAVLPFQHDAGVPASGHRLASYLGGRLEWYPAWTVVPLPTAFAWWDSTPPAHRLERVRGAPRARLYVHGEIIPRSQGALLRLTLRDSSSRLVQLIDVPGEIDDLLGWGSAGADSIVSRVFPRDVDDYRAATQRSSSSVPAVNEWLQGQQDFRADHWLGAEAHYLRALDLDPGFAQAAWDLALVRRWRRDGSATAVLRQLWATSRDNLPAMQRLLTEAQLEPDLDRRLALLREAVRRFPSRAEAWLLYGNELLSRGPLAGVPVDSGVAAFMRTTRLEPFTTALEHAVLGDMRMGARDAARRDLRRLEATSRSGDAEAALRRQLLAFAYNERFVPWRGRLSELWLGWHPDSALLGGIHLYARMGDFFDIPGAQAFLGRTLVAHGTGRPMLASGHEAQGLALLLLGRPTAALAELDSAAVALGTAEAGLQFAQWPALVSALDLGDPSPERLARARARLVGMADTPGGTRAAWTLAVEALHRHDSMDAVRWTSRVASNTADPDAQCLHDLLLAMTAAGRGRVDSAVALAMPLLRYDPRGLGGDPFARALLHLELGSWLAERGDAAGAERTWLWTDAWDVKDWPEGAAQAGEVDAAVGAVARLRRARLALERAHTNRGCRLLARVRELWSGAEPALPAGRLADSLARACP